MSRSLLFTDKDDRNNLDASSNPILQSTESTEEVNIWSEITLTENDVCY